MCIGFVGRMSHVFGRRFGCQNHVRILSGFKRLLACAIYGRFSMETIYEVSKF